MSVVADTNERWVKNFVRDYHLPWSGIERLEAGQGDNVTGAAKAIKVRRSDGTTVIARGAASYPRRKVEAWRDLLAGAGP